MIVWLRHRCSHVSLCNAEICLDTPFYTQADQMSVSISLIVACSMSLCPVSNLTFFCRLVTSLGY